MVYPSLPYYPPFIHASPLYKQAPLSINSNPPSDAMIRREGHRTFGTVLEVARQLISHYQGGFHEDVFVIYQIDVGGQL